MPKEFDFVPYNLVPQRNTEKFEDIVLWEDFAERLVLAFLDGKFQPCLRLNWLTCTPDMQTD